ncbi:hypothetical protein [Deferrisoma sp.]
MAPQAVAGAKASGARKTPASQPPSSWKTPMRTLEIFFDYV